MPLRVCDKECYVESDFLTVWLPGIILRESKSASYRGRGTLDKKNQDENQSTMFQGPQPALIDLSQKRAVLATKR